MTDYKDCSDQDQPPTERAGADANGADPSDTPPTLDFIAAAWPDCLTILTTADNKRLAKRHYVDTEGAMKSADYDRAYLVMMRRLPVDNLADVYRVMSEIKTNECLIWGKPLVDESAVVRRLYQDEANGDKATIADMPHHVLPLDFDLEPGKKHCPADWETMKPRQQVEYCISLLPPEFADGACVAQLTGSAGVKPGIRLRLVFWLEQPITGEQAKEYLKDTPVDLGIYTPNQPIYAAPPIFENGRANPVTEKRLVLLAGRETVANQVPFVAERAATKVTANGADKLRTLAEIEETAPFVAKCDLAAYDKLRRPIIALGRMNIPEDPNKFERQRIAETLRDEVSPDTTSMTDYQIERLLNLPLIKDDAINPSSWFHYAKQGGYTRRDPSARMAADGAPNADHPKGLRLQLISGAQVEPEEVVWLWKGHYARGKVHLRAGPPDMGKNVTAINNAAILSRGGTWPDGAQAPIGDTLIWSGEDSFTDTTLPRFLAAGGDRARLFKVHDVLDEEGTRRHFDPATDGPLLRDALMANPNIIYVILDPISVVVGSGHGASHNDAETRRALAPIVALAEERGIVVEGIIHFRKRGTGTSKATLLERIIGATAFGAVARIVHALDRGGEGKPRRFVRIKCNLVEGWDAGVAIGFEYTLDSVPVPGYPKLGTLPKVVWGNPLHGDPEDLLGDAPVSMGRPATKRTEAGEWLTDRLQLAGKKGIKVEPDLKEAAEADGHSWRTIERVKKALPIVGREIVGTPHAGWYWCWIGPNH